MLSVGPATFTQVSIANDREALSPSFSGKVKRTELFVARLPEPSGYTCAPVDVSDRLPRIFVSEGVDVDGAKSLETGVNVAFIVK